MVDPDNDESRIRAGQFPATRHSAIIALRSGNSTQRERARDSIAQVYWQPVFHYLRVKWNRSTDDAHDLAQGFFLRLMEKNFFQDYDASRTRFRTYLRICLDRFVQRQDREGAAMKRGGEAILVDTDIAALDTTVGDLGPNRTAAPDEAFEQEWIRGLLSSAVEELRQHCHEQDHALDFVIFEKYDLGQIDNGQSCTYAELAKSLGVSVDTITNRLASARREFRRIVLDLIRGLTSSEDEFREEVRAVLGIDA